MQGRVQGGAQGAWAPPPEKLKSKKKKKKKKAFRFWAPPLANSWTRACNVYGAVSHNCLFLAR